jgi:methyl-accepting chemotaxis protein
MLLSLVRKPRPAKEPENIEPVASAGSEGDLAGVVRDLAEHATSIAREAAELRGSIDEVAGVARHEAAAFEALGGEVGSMIDANAAIVSVVESNRRSAQAAKLAADQIADDVAKALESLREVAEVAAEITRIALQTRLVAFNAAVEAKHAGDAGRGFSVVAEAVKELAQKVESSSKAIGSKVGQLDLRIGELAEHIRDDRTAQRRDTRATADAAPTLSRAFANMVEATDQIVAVTERNRQSCDAARTSLQRLQSGVQGTTRALEGARDRTESFLAASEFLIQKAADCGARTVDSPFIEKVEATAAEISALFERAAERGEISLDDLFDSDYRPIAGSNPQQHLTRHVAFTDRVLPAIQEAMLEFSDRVVFCAAVDRNGYLPTHNRKFSQTPGRDPVWNAANCRNRRIFNDRTGLAAGRNQHRFLLQTYRRDMGGGQFKLMKDISAPIVVAGRHWGGLRIAYAY